MYVTSHLPTFSTLHRSLAVTAPHTYLHGIPAAVSFPYLATYTHEHMMESVGQDGVGVCDIECCVWGSCTRHSTFLWFGEERKN